MKTYTDFYFVMSKQVKSWTGENLTLITGQLMCGHCFSAVVPYAPPSVNRFQDSNEFYGKIEYDCKECEK